MSLPEASIQQAWGAPPVALDGISPNDALYKRYAFSEQQLVTVGAVAQLVDITQSSFGASTPKFLDQGLAIEIEARSDDVYVRFRPDAGEPGTTAGAASNGRRIPKGTFVVWWLPGLTFLYMDIVSVSAGNPVAFRRASMPRDRG